MHEDAADHGALPGQSVSVPTYRFLYPLAHEVAHKAINAAHPMDACRYSMGAVLLAYATIETFVDHLLFSAEYKASQPFRSLSGALRDQIARYSTPDKLALLFTFDPPSKVARGYRGDARFQALVLLQQLSNQVVHAPSMEAALPPAALLELEQAARQHFKVIEAASGGVMGQAFGTRVFNKNCAVWALGQIQPFLDWLCEALEIEKQPLQLAMLTGAAWPAAEGLTRVDQERS